MLYALTWLSGVLCYCVYKLGGSSVGRGFEGRATAQQRGRQRALGAVVIQILYFILRTPDCSFNFI